jgi:rare lipoprotein A
MACGITSLIVRPLASQPTNAIERKIVFVRASFYADKFEGRKMANGSRFHQSVVTAASLQFPLGTTVRVHSISTGQDLVVRITDRGPWTKHGLDLSKAAFDQLGLKRSSGWGWVVITGE